MNVDNTAWQLAGAGNDSDLVLQNLGYTRIAYVIQPAQPAPNDIALDTGAHALLNPGDAPITITGMDADGTSCYVRSLGPRTGELYVK